MIAAPRRPRPARGPASRALAGVHESVAATPMGASRGSAPSAKVTFVATGEVARTGDGIGDGNTAYRQSAAGAAGLTHRGHLTNDLVPVLISVY